MKTILVVDDEIDLVDLLAWNLNLKGYKVMVAYDGAEAISAVEHDVPDLVLMDVMMPRMDGMTALRRLRQGHKTKHVPIVLVTARRESSMIFDAVKGGATDVMLKPFSMTDLMQWVERWLSGNCMQLTYS
jgi:DNA-binding response OmpR family regulator